MNSVRSYIKEDALFNVIEDYAKEDYNRCYPKRGGWFQNYEWEKLDNKCKEAYRTHVVLSLFEAFVNQAESTRTQTSSAPERPM